MKNSQVRLISWIMVLVLVLSLLLMFSAKKVEETFANFYMAAACYVVYQSINREKTAKEQKDSSLSRAKLMKRSQNMINVKMKQVRKSLATNANLKQNKRFTRRWLQCD